MAEKQKILLSLQTVDHFEKRNKVTITHLEARMHLDRLINIIQVTSREVIITKHGAPAAVLISHDFFESWKETVSVRSDAALMREIKAGLKDLKAKKARLYTLAELF